VSLSGRINKLIARADLLVRGVTSLRGPVERIDGQLILRIPMAAGGSRFVRCARGIGKVRDGYLHVEIPQWMAEKLSINEGSIVNIDNRHGRFTITPE
jgi:hypothetical protein